MLQLGNVKGQGHLTPQEVKQTINNMGFKFPDIVYKQYVIESGLGTSNLGRNANNLFGVKKVTKRPTTANGATKSGFSIYKSQRESIVDRLLLELYSGWHKLSREQYLNKMKTVYCKDCGNDYLNKLN